MATRKTTTDLLKLLEEVCEALRELPEIPLAEFRQLFEKKSEKKPAKKTKAPEPSLLEFAEVLPTLDKAEAEKQLTKKTVPFLKSLCKQLNVNPGSDKKKENLIKQIIWRMYGMNDSLDTIEKHTDAASDRE